MTALGMLVAAKVLNVQVPFFFKGAVNSLNDLTGHTLTLSEPVSAVTSSAFALVVACKYYLLYRLHLYLLTRQFN